jgi:hypothetical protein
MTIGFVGSRTTAIAIKAPWTRVAVKAADVETPLTQDLGLNAVHWNISAYQEQ